MKRYNDRKKSKSKSSKSKSKSKSKHTVIVSDSDDEAANEDLTLKIIEKAMSRASNSTAAVDGDSSVTGGEEVVVKEVAKVDSVKKKKRVKKAKKKKQKAGDEEEVVVDSTALIKVICGVDHEDLKQLLFVSKTVRDVAIIAKKSHFAYSTPSKTKAFRDSIEILNDINAPEYSDRFQAPKKAGKINRKRFDSTKIDEISVALFSDDDTQQRWPSRRSLFMDIDS